MRILSIIMSFVFIAFFNNQSIAQLCHVDATYYYHHHHKNKYRSDRNSIIDFRRRIDEGVYSGELTRREERYLKRKLNDLINVENRAYRNGHITRYERRKIEKRKRRLDRKIYKKKHNSRTRY